MPPTLGQRLRHAREQRKLSAEDVAFQTKIPASHVRDLEDNAYTSFGSLTYARSFLKAYADFLRIDATDVLQHLQSPPLGGARDYRYLIEDYGQWVDGGHSHQAMTPPQRPAFSTRPLVIAASISVFALVATVGVLVANASIFKPKPPPRDDHPSLIQKADTQPLSARQVPDVIVEKPAVAPPKALVVPDKNTPPPRAEIVQ